MITKLATFRGVSPEGEPLVRVFEQGGSLIKEAGALMPQIKQWMSSYRADDGKIAVLVNALGASEYWGQNVNGDVFPEAALLHDCRNHNATSHPVDDYTGKVIPPYGYWTFLNAFPFVHHRNKDPNRAFGHVALAVWNPRMHRVELIVILDKAKAMQYGAQHVIDRILAGEFPDVSMGCRVPYDVCTICGNKSKTRNDYCSCVKLIGMNKILDDGRRIGVINLHPRFFDISFVFIGADKTAKVMCKLASGIIVPQSVADADELYDIPDDDGLLKAASVQVPANFYFEKTAQENTALSASPGGDLAASNLGEGPADPREILNIGLTSIESNGKKVTILNKEAPSPSETRLLFSRTDPQEDIQHASVGDGVLQTNAKVGDDEDDERGAVNPTKQASRRGAIMDFYLRRARGENPPAPGNVDRRSEVHDFYTKQANGDDEGGKTPTEEDVRSFLEGHPNPVDADFHAWAEKNGFNVHKAEAMAYRIASAHVKEGASSLSKLFEAAKLITIGKPPVPNRKEFPFVGTINFRGLVIHVENVPGSVREGKGPDGKVRWRTNMKLPYGEILGSLGTDGDKLDVYVGPYRDAPNAFIIHQNFVRGPRKGKYDEDKVMLGFETPEQARDAYIAHYDSPRYFRSITAMAFPLFKRAVMKKEVHGEKVAAAYQQIVTDIKLEDEFQVKTAAHTVNPRGMYRTLGEAAAAAAEVNAELPEDMVSLLGLVPRLDEMSGKYFLSYRPLSRKMMEELFLKHGSAMEKLAVRADLDHLFQGAASARRRERTWKDKVTNKETTEVGSGLNKTASAPSPEVVKIASILHNGWGPEELLKVSNAFKAASHLKWADIVKRIGPSKAVGRVTPLLSQTEETLPKELLNELGQKPDLEKSLTTPSLMGMVLKPEEFQRIILSHLGKEPLADKLDDAGAVFKPTDDEACPCSALSPEHMDPALMKALLPFMEGKSYLGPIVRRRIIRITVAKPEPETSSTEVESPLLSKVAAAYTWYRRELMKLARDLPATVTSHPDLHAGLYALGTEDIFSKTAAGELPLDRRSIALLLGTVPLSLMYSAHKRGQIRKGEDVGMLGQLVAEHPWLTSMGVVTGLGAALRHPSAQQAVDELFAAGKRVWEGKQGPVEAMQ